MGDGLHAVHAEGDEAAGPDTKHTESSADDPGQGAAFRDRARQRQVRLGLIGDFG